MNPTPRATLGSAARYAWPVVALGALLTVATILLSGRDRALETVLIVALVNTAMVVGLQVFVGNSGVVSFGQVSFMAVGAYVSGMFSIPAVAKAVVIPNAPAIFRDTELPFVPSVLAGGLAAGVVAVLISIPLLRLSGIGASIGTLSLLVITNTFFTNWKPGSSGGGNLTRIPTDTTALSALVCVLVFLAISWAYQRSRFGLRLRASREDEVAARAVGVRVGMERRIAFILSGTMFGVVGGLYAHSIGSISANAFWFHITFLGLAMLVLGGTRSLAGAVLGAALISTISYLFDEWQDGDQALGVSLPVPAGSGDLAIALVLVLVLILRPEGITGGRELPWPRRRAADVSPPPTGKQPS